MNKVKMTQEQMRAVRSLKSAFGFYLYEISNKAFHDNHQGDYKLINNMKEDQIAAAWLGADHCEIEPEYEAITHVEAFNDYLHGHEVEVKFTSHVSWIPVDNYYKPVFFDKTVKFRRQKP